MSRDRTPPTDDARLEAALERAWDGSAPRGAGPSSEVAIAAALGTFRQQRRRRVAAASLACLLLVGAGIWIARTGDETPAHVETADAIRYGNALYRRVMGSAEDPDGGDLDYLKRDGAARAEYLAALDHPSSFVRRVAMTALSYSGVEIPADVLLRMLVEHREDLERPLALASVGDAGRYVAEALERRRLATIRDALEASSYLAAGGHERLPVDAVEPWLEHEDASVRSFALGALAEDPGYEAGERVFALLRADPDAQVRTAALHAIQARGGTDGARRLLAHARTMDDPSLEPAVLHALRSTPGVEAMVRARLASGVADAGSRMAHARLLLQAGDPSAAERLVPAVLQDGPPAAVEIAAQLVVAMDRADLRPAVVARRGDLGAAIRRRVALALFRWDIAATELDEARVARVLDSLAELAVVGQRYDAGQLAPHREHPDARIRAAVRATLDALGP